MHDISAPQLAVWLADGSRQAPLLLDVREAWEFDTCRIEGAQLLPLHTLPQQVTQRLARLDPAAPIVCICHHGMRSRQAALFLEQSGFSEVHNLAGGVHAWACQVDPAMSTY